MVPHRHMGHVCEYFFFFDEVILFFFIMFVNTIYKLVVLCKTKWHFLVDHILVCFCVSVSQVFDVTVPVHIG